ncbi:TonB-dependent receptor (plasmid) [Catenovulum sp. SX2]|uniref:TonB-dependent receptor n=1 Tax=Catenovulum sp. SX2 TaxID=3398614 RepID=UPI003F86513D
MLENYRINSKIKKSVLAISCALFSLNTQAAEQDSEKTEVDETIAVQGVRGAQAAAIDFKREASNIVDSIVAEDIGKLPDTTIVDSLQRVTGVQIKREGNEGTSLNVRGMPQVLTTLNGEQFLSPWSITGVSANYSDVPASMISGVDVYKSMSSNLLSGGISGLVDLKTTRPLALKEGFTAKLKLEASYGDNSNKKYTPFEREVTNDDGSTSIERGSEQSTRDPDHNVHLFLGYNNQTVGFTFGAYSSESNAANYQMWDDSRLAFLKTRGGSPHDPLDLDGDGDTENDWYLTPGNFGARANLMERTRSGGASSIEIKLSDQLSMRGDVFYTQMDQYDRGVAANFNGQSSLQAYEENGTPASSETDLYNALQDDSIVAKGADISFVDANGNTQNRTINTLQVAHVIAPDFMTNTNTNINHTAALNSNFQVDYVSDNFEATARVVYAKAQKQFRNMNLSQGQPAWLWVDQDGISGKDPLAGYDVTVDYRGDVPVFDFEADLSQSELLQKYQAQGYGEDTDATLAAIRFDASYFAEYGMFNTFNFGVRYGERKADHAKFFYVAPTGRTTTWDDPRVPADKRYQLREGNEVWQKYPEWLDFNYENENSNLRTIGGLVDNGFDATQTTVHYDFGPIKGFEGGVAALDPHDMDKPLEFMNRLYPGSKTANDPGYTYKVTETSSSAFFQANFSDDTGLFGIPFEGDLGVRFVRTEREIEKTIVPTVLDKFNSIGYYDWEKIAFVADKETIHHSFTDVLPSANINFFPDDDVIVRFGVSKNMTRNDLNNVGSSLFLWYQQCAKTDEDGNRIYVRDTNGNLVGENVSCVGGGNDQGNPYIKPWRATVFNSSAEWYFAQDSILGVGIFLIDVDTAVQSFQEQRNYADGDGINRGNMANIWTTKNVTASDLSGIEIGYKQPFTFLPGEFLSSLGMEFNYTYSDSKSTDVDINGDNFPLASNSKHQTNTILWYAKDGLNMRLAYNWRSAEYIGRVGLNTNEAPLSLGNWQEASGYLDASINYWYNEHLSFYVSGTNLTSQDRKTYAQFENQFHSLYVQERRYTAGVTLSL